MPNKIDEMMARLSGASDWNFAMKELRTWTEPENLVSLWRAIEASENTKDRTAYDAVADDIEELLALRTDPRSFDAVREVLTHERVAPGMGTRARTRDVRVRGLASRMAYARGKESFLASLAKEADVDRHFDLYATWLHELVLRGAALANEPAVKDLKTEMDRRHHALAVLPLRLLASEREAPSYMPMYGEGALERAVERLERGPASMKTIPPPAEHEAPKVTRVSDADTATRLLQAFKPWTEGSNGKTEAVIFSLSPKVDPMHLGRWLVRALPLDSTRGATVSATHALRDGSGVRDAANATPSLDIERAEPEAVWGSLFAAAANGGAYTSGMGGAYGRLAAWTSFGALVGAVASASLDTVDELAMRSSFLVFTGTEWFHDIAWDLGVVALRPDGASVAVLAATDTD